MVSKTDIVRVSSTQPARLKSSHFSMRLEGEFTYERTFRAAAEEVKRKEEKKKRKELKANKEKAFEMRSLDC